MKTAHSASIRIKDMTAGDPLRLILAFSVPLFIGNIFQQVYSMVDTMVVGYCLGDQAIAAIGATTTLYSIIVNFAWALNNGYAIVITQRFGARNIRGMRQAIAGTIMLDAGITALLTVLALCFLGPLMAFMNTPEAILADAYAYIAIIYAGMFATIAYNMFAGILRAMGNSRSPLYFLILASLLNIALDLLFVLVAGFGVAGAALATVIAQTISAVLCGVYTLRSYGDYMPRREHFAVPRETLRDLATTGLAMALMISVIDFGSLIYQRANNALGEIIITSHMAARRIIGIFTQPISSIAAALSTFVGQNFGAGRKDRIRTAIRQICAVEVVFSAVAFAVLYVTGGAIVRLVTGTADARIIANSVMSIRIHSAFFPALALVLCIRMSMQSMGEKRAPILSSCIELAMKFFAAAWFIPRLGFLGTSLTEPVTWAIMAAFLCAAYIRKRAELLGRDWAD